MSDNLLVLLEMIEEVLNEATLTYKDLGKRNNKKLFFDKIKNGEPFETKDGREVVIDAEKSKPFLDLVENNQPLPKGVKMVTTAGEEISFSGLQKTGTAFGTGGSVTKSKYASNRIAELFEGNLVAALNGSPGTMKDGGRDGWMADAPFPQRAEEIITKTDGLELGQGGFEKLATEAGDITPLYLMFGAKNSTPKTDIASKALKISVKKKGGTILSAEAGESQALLAVAYGFTNKLSEKTGELEANIDKSSESYRHIIEVAKGLAKSVWNKPNLTSKKRRQLGDAALVKLFKEGPHDPKDVKFKVFLEAITGDNRFKRAESKADHILVWQWDPNEGSLTPIKEWAEANNEKLKLDIRWRGEKRSGGFRIDGLTGPYKKKMEKLLGIDNVYVNEQSLSQDRTQDSPAPSLQSALPPGQNELASQFAQLFASILVSELASAEVIEIVGDEGK